MASDERIGEMIKTLIILENEYEKMSEIEFDQVENREMIPLEILKMNEIFLATKKQKIHLMIRDLSDEKRRRVVLI
jgi:hypothetical protein